MSDTIPATDPDAAVGEPDEAPRSARVLVAILFVLLLVPGLIGFDFWPLTGWRLFSLSRGAELIQPQDQVSGWVIEVVDEDGAHRVVGLEELPLPYRHAAWSMSRLPDASDARRTAVCEALLTPVRQILPDTRELVIARDHARLVEGDDGSWTATHEIEPLHSCSGARQP